MNYTYDERRAFYYLMKIAPTIETDRQENFADWCKSKNIISAVPKGKGLSKICRTLKTLAQVPAGTLRSAVSNNIQFLSTQLDLSAAESSLLEGAVLWYKMPLFRSMARYCSGHDNHLSVLDLAAFADLSEEETQLKLSEHSPLIKYGLLARHRYDPNDFCVPRSMFSFITTQYSSTQEAKTALLGRALAEEWTEKDFAYIAQTDFAAKLMKNAAKTRGLNILLYGAPGTGKTSFAQMLAHCAKLNLYTVGEDEEETAEQNYRLRQLHLKQGLLAKDESGCLLFDEAEDIFSSNMTRCSKVGINRLLENNTCPVIWTTNNIRRMDPAFIRRFTLAVHFEQPPEKIQRKIWVKHLAENNLPHSYRQTQKLAEEFPVVPSLIAGAAKAARLINGDLDTVREHIQIMTQALRGGRKEPKEEKTVELFNPSLINADMDLESLSQRLKTLGRLNFSLCLYGASGTGKSAYARYLASELDLKIMHKRASDLIGPYVGETEQHIAAAFARAKEEKAMLIFDEADSFLQDRSRAVRSWEITAVNEMLTWMENHPYPFICTTNLMDTVDTAALRRFSFKVKYDFLTSEQVCIAFKHFFGLPVKEQEIDSLRRLTPGDFALVKNKAELLGQTKQLGKLKELLQTEQSIKMTRGAGSSIGFRL